MVTLWKEGADVVHTVRNKREKESIFKKITANIFYRILSSNSNVNSTRNAGDFKLITKRIINIIKTTNAKQIYLRGLIDWYSVNSKVIFYDRKPRFAGKRKYKSKQSFELALNGLITYSDFLQNFLARVFLFFIILLLLLIIFLIYSVIDYSDSLVKGLASIVTILIITNIIQLFGFFFNNLYLRKLLNQSSLKIDNNISRIY